MSIKYLTRNLNKTICSYGVFLVVSFITALNATAQKDQGFHKIGEFGDLHEGWAMVWYGKPTRLDLLMNLA